MNDKQKTIVYALAALVVLAVLIFVLCLFQGAYAQTSQEPILVPQVEETITYPEETENTPETANESVTEVFTEPEPQPVYAEVESCEDCLTAWGGVYHNEDTGLTETWYSQKVLPGGGLDIPGRHVNEQGLVCDGDGYICVASNNHEYGEEVMTSLGAAKVYDSIGGETTGVLDVYTNW